jgi:hypothetical protein
MLRDKSGDLEPARPEWTGGKLFTMSLAGTLVAALLGALLWLVLGSFSDRSQLGTAIAFGAVFGGWIGLSACLLFGLIRRLREYGIRSPVRSAIIFAVLGGIAASPLFAPFADGWGMAIGGLVEAAIIGGCIGTVLGIFLFFVMFRRRTSEIAT